MKAQNIIKIETDVEAYQLLKAIYEECEYTSFDDNTSIEVWKSEDGIVEITYDEDVQSVLKIAVVVNNNKTVIFED